MTKEPSATQSPLEPGEAVTRGFSFPKKSRILRSADFRRVYKDGFRVSGPFFTAFCLAQEGTHGPRVGFTVPRALGKSVKRNRIKRRLRETVRLQLGQVGSQWSIVLNARRSVLTAPFEDLQREIQRLFLKCGKQ